MKTDIEYADGRITPYGFACGYAESYDTTGLIGSFYADNVIGDSVMLYRDGTYHVKSRRGADMYWDSFETLTEARNWVKKIRTAIKNNSRQPSGSWNWTWQFTVE